TAGVPFSITVTAKDAYNNVATGYLGSVGFSGGGTGATLPGTHAFTAGDAGAHNFGGVILTQAGTRTITATDTTTASITGSANVTVNPAGAASLTVTAPASQTAGAPFSVSVTAKDAYGNVATGYLGTVHFSGGGTGATLPANYTFTAGDA